mmetsp:Transcript_13018/g.24177  ORF Transcript_13018/g.24177 Transcript_13018/m.24177 type:complete len:519 (-) Transcript_13018:3071-4627(-)
MGKQKGQLQLVSLGTLGEFEQDRVVNTPRSLEACRREGIDPEELLYIPPEAFTQPHLSVRLQHLHFEFFEAKRKEIVEIVKRARERVIEEEEGSIHKSRSTGSIKAHQKMFGSVVEQAKEKHLKMITRLLNYESLATEKLQEMQAQELEQAKLAAKKEKQRVKQERKAAEEKRLLDIKKLEEAKEEERQAKKKAVKLFQQDMDEAMRRQAQEDQEAQIRAKKKAKNEAKRIKHLIKMEENLSQQQAEREAKFLAKQAAEEERQRKLEQKKEKLKKKLQKIGKLREQKRSQVIDNVEARIDMKRQIFEQRQEELQRKARRYQHQLTTSVERLKSLSAERDDKIIRTRELAEQIQEEKRKLILQKSQEADIKVEKVKEILSENIEFKKHEEMLRSLKKEWNVRRRRRKEDYMKSKVKQKMIEDERRIQHFLKDRDFMIKQRQDFNTKHMLQKYEIKQALLRMAVTKKWDTEFLKSISQEERSVKTATSSQSRPHFKTKSFRPYDNSPKEEAPPPRISSPL